MTSRTTTPEPAGSSAAPRLRDSAVGAESSVAPVAAALNRAGLPRLDAVDMLRGLVIALMVLDHVREYFHAGALEFDPTDPARTTPILFATRWITHLCAPTFVFLAGVSVFLQRANGKQPAALSRHLLTRGLWLIALEVTIVGFGFNFAWTILFLQVIWAIGIGMILLAALIRLPPAAVLIIGAIIVAGHALLGPLQPQDVGVLAPLWILAMEPGPLLFLPGFIAYPFLPWLGVMCLGYGLGFVFLMPPAQRRRTWLALGCGAIGLFIVLRAINVYGDPVPWRSYQNSVATFLSFMNVSKYPPSLFYVLITLGVSLAMLPLLERLGGFAGRLLLAFGRTPLFTYVLHVYFVHSAALLAGVAVGLPASFFANFLGDPSRLVKAGWGFDLATIYLLWLLLLVALYPLSRWFAQIKRHKRDWWLGYL